jgi:hypothetical protein
LGAEQ